MEFKNHGLFDTIFTFNNDKYIELTPERQISIAYNLKRWGELEILRISRVMLETGHEEID
jgi:hypothetical protein